MKLAATALGNWQRLCFFLTCSSGSWCGLFGTQLQVPTGSATWQQGSDYATAATAAWVQQIQETDCIVTETLDCHGNTV